MNIGFDAKWYFTGNPSGRVVVRNLIDNIVKKYCNEHEFHFFLKSSDRKHRFPHAGPRIHCHYVISPTNCLSNVFIIPLYSFFIKIDVCIFQYFSPFFSKHKRIAFIHDVIFEEKPEHFTLFERLYFIPMRMLANRAHRICTVSNTEKARPSQLRYGSPAKIDVVYNGVSQSFRPKNFHRDSALQEAKSLYNIPDEFILYVGRLNQRKNIPALLKSIPLLNNKEIPLVLAGTYDWKSFDLPKLIADQNIAHRVISCGFVKDEFLPILYSLASIFCYVSHDEGFGLPPLEAMASGVPIVVSDTPVLQEVCGDAGNYVNPEKPALIAQMIDVLLNDRQLYNKKKELGLVRAHAFTWENAADSLMQCIKKTFSNSCNHL